MAGGQFAMLIVTHAACAAIAGLAMWLVVTYRHDKMARDPKEH